MVLHNFLQWWTIKGTNGEEVQNTAVIIDVDAAVEDMGNMKEFFKEVITSTAHHDHDHYRRKLGQTLSDSYYKINGTLITLQYQYHGLIIVIT